MAKPSIEVSDDQLVCRMRDGDRVAFEVLYERHYADVEKYVRRLCPGLELVDDVVSEAFFKTLRAVANGRGPVDGFRLYIFTAARTTAIRMMGVASVEAASPMMDLLLDEADGGPLEVGEGEGAAVEALRALPERAQRVLWLMEVEGWTSAEVGRAMNISANAASALAYRSRQRLRERYQKMLLELDPPAWPAAPHRS
ncbi:MAG TPA: sigma-70 family RNA polymerase sigma factor [Acidimicrobiales bacterium]|nr:sigma-70 family RNA polymerase sigma factor [Acidimicrobiales bacterium]